MKKNKLNLIYDDRLDISPDVKELINVNSYSNTIYQRNTILNIIKGLNKSFSSFFHLTDEKSILELNREILTKKGEYFFILSSSVFPINPDYFNKLIDKCAYCNETALLLSSDDKHKIILADYDYLTLWINNLLDGKDDFPDFNFNFDLNSSNVEKFFYLDNRSSLIQFLWNSTGTRSFNTITQKNNTLTKSSFDKEKMKSEYNFYHLSNSKMKQFLIPTFDYKINNKGIASYSMEHLLIPDASIYFVNKSFTEEKFQLFCDKFFEYCSSREIKKCNQNEIKELFQHTIINKMEKRIIKFLACREGDQLNNIFFNYAGIHIDELSNRAINILNHSKENDSADYMCVSHGDTCFSNILFDSRLQMFKLIDAKGGVKNEDIFRHPLYDVAKFSHSILGGYDLINHGLFDLNIDDCLKISLTKEKIDKIEQFKNYFIKKCHENNYNLKDVRCIELSLFISMIPLHVEKKKNILAFLQNAYDLLIELENGKEYLS